MRMTKTEAEKRLNQIGPPDHDNPAHGGRLPRQMLHRYGTWLRKHDPIAFEIYIREENRNQ